MNRVVLLSLGTVAVSALAAGDTVLCTAEGLEPSQSVEILWTWSLSLLVVWWVRNDYYRSRYWPCFEYETFMFAGWLLLFPHYLVRTRGARGLLIFLGFMAVLLLTVVAVTIAAVVIRL